MVLVVSKVPMVSVPAVQAPEYSRMRKSFDQKIV